MKPHFQLTKTEMKKSKSCLVANAGHVRDIVEEGVELAGYPAGAPLCHAEPGRQHLVQGFGGNLHPGFVIGAAAGPQPAGLRRGDLAALVPGHEVHQTVKAGVG